LVIAAAAATGKQANSNQQPHTLKPASHESACVAQRHRVSPCDGSVQSISLGRSGSADALAKDADRMPQAFPKQVSALIVFAVGSA